MSGTTPGQTATTFYYGFLPDGNLRAADDGFPPEVSARLSELRPTVLAALDRNDYATAVSVALGALEALACELRPPWADSLTQDEALVQAVMVEVGCGPADALPGATLDEPIGTSVWVIYRAWSTSRAEALSAAQRLGANPTLIGESDSPLPLKGEEDRPSTLWTQVWI